MNESGPIALRGYREEDLDDMYVLDVACFEPPFRFSRASMRRFARAKKAYVVIAEDGEALAGFCILHLEQLGRRRVGYIVTLDISTTYRRKGLGRGLMREVERHAIEEGCVALALHVFAGNETAMQFYKGSGFAASHRVKAFYGDRFDAWVFHKSLAP